MSFNTYWQYGHWPNYTRTHSLAKLMTVCQLQSRSGGRSHEGHALRGVCICEPTMDKYIGIALAICFCHRQGKGCASAEWAGGLEAGASAGGRQKSSLLWLVPFWHYVIALFAPMFFGLLPSMLLLLCWQRIWLAFFFSTFYLFVAARAERDRSSLAFS